MVACFYYYYRLLPKQSFTYTIIHTFTHPPIQTHTIKHTPLCRLFIYVPLL